MKVKITPLHRALSWYVVILIGLLFLALVGAVIYNAFFEVQPFTRQQNPGIFVCHTFKSAFSCDFFDYLKNLAGWWPWYLLAFIYYGGIIFVIGSVGLVWGLYWYFKKER